jgi:hypothetical protein
VDFEAILKQLEEDMANTGRGGFRPEEVVGLVLAARNKVAEKRTCATCGWQLPNDCEHDGDCRGGSGWKPM